MKVLIVDDEDGIREIISFIIEEMTANQWIVSHARSGQEAVSKMQAEQFDLCICDHNMPDGMGPSVLKFIIEQKLNVKFVLCSTVIPSDDPVSYPEDHVFTNIQKPDIFQGVEKLTGLLSHALLPKDLELDSREFIPVTVDFLSLVRFVPADVYIKLSDRKMVKCFNKGSVFSQEEKEKYKQKEVGTLYLKTEGEKNIVLHNIKKRIREFLTGSDLKLTDRLALTHHQICAMIKLEGLTSEHQETVKEIIQQTAKIISSNEKLSDLWDRMDILGDYPSQLYSLQVMLASLILKKLNWNSDATFIKVSLAAFLQDITLDNLELLKIKDYAHFFAEKERFSDDDKKQFLAHPAAASELIAKFKEVPPDVDRIVLEQHEMPNGNGFPKMLSATHTGPLSCLFILTGIVAKELIANKGQFSRRQFIEQFEKDGYNKGNYKESFDAIASLLN